MQYYKTQNFELEHYLLSTEKVLYNVKLENTIIYQDLIMKD